MALTHIHRRITSRDCDGMYERDAVLLPNDDETPRQLWTWHVNHWIDGLSWRDSVHMISRTDEATSLPILEVAERTEEGYHLEILEGCDDARCNPRATRYRDHTAEAAGY